ncbi:two-component sensor histidine kinase [Bacillus sp. FJAT-27225]|uniref:sensor histidine kinase n=1 Tax=Bacillus sp. FJAT-27225 TaxID=1743144 RepID=UPI00080C2BF3|nr:sensor histidine kinase [Bacillus sp. FJAT-27225]OCA83092.1 two-component sensor histidine kinase [Bacillus sp. FJAT-27225]
MSAIQRQVVWGLGFAFLLTAASTAAFFAVYPLEKWSYLWTKDVMGIPFLIFTPLFGCVLGTIGGFLAGQYWRSQFALVEQSLRQIEEGHYSEQKGSSNLYEMKQIQERIGNLNRQLTEKAKISQRLATEKAEVQENRIQEIISQERNRLARELHDSVSQQLFAASMMMSAITEGRRDGDPHGQQLKLVEGMIHQSQIEMRALLLHLRPAALKGKSLQEGIAELMNELAQKVTIDISWKAEDFLMDKGVEDHLFRILQESVSNTLRHAKANSLSVLLVKRDGLIILRVTDDGVGFDEADRKAGSYGMQNMHERALEVGGTLKVISVKNKGTRLEVKVPAVSNGDGEND